MKRTILTVSLLLALASFAQADNWPQWRGPDNTGVSKEKGIPTSWSAKKNLAWKLDLPGKGSSTPIIWGDRIFLTGAEGNKLALWCISTEGKLLWKSNIASEVKGNFRKDEGNEASPTPSTDGKNVFVFLGTGDFACFDFTGKPVWQFNVQDRYKKKFSMYHGVHVTPVLHGDHLYMNLIHTNGQWVFAIDKATGKEVWKIDRESDAISESRESYASPVLWQNGKDMNLVVLGSDYTTGHSLTDGKELWRLGDLNPKGKKYSPALRIIASPVASADQLYVPTARNGLFVTLKQGATGKINAGSQFEAWRIPKGAPDVPSPLYHDGIVYLQGDRGLMIAVDGKTGTELYNQRVGEGRYRGSPIWVDGHVYTLGRDNGIVNVLKAGPKGEVVANNPMDDEFTASPAIANGRLYLRGFKSLYAISEGGK